MFKPKVLFVCTGNSCRSQIAEGIMRDKAGDHYEVFSAGSHPSRVNPMAIKVMDEWGIDISYHTSDSVNII
jgi:arsenate reductase